MILNESNITNFMFSQLRSLGYEYIMPNLMLRQRDNGLYCGEYECDIFAINRSGYTNEFEIKISVSDFKADKKKCHTYGHFTKEGEQTVYKHDLIKAGKRVSKFWYIMPEDMVKVEDIPEYAGLIYIKVIIENGIEKMQMIKIKEAPKLNKEKENPAILKQIMRTGYYRYIDLYRRFNELVEENVRLSKKLRLQYEEEGKI